jgi:hypothetical protein
MAPKFVFKLTGSSIRLSFFYGDIENLGGIIGLAVDHFISI